MIPISRVVTNRVGSANHFRPLPSAAQGDASRLSYPQSFAGRVPGKVLANEVVLAVQALPLDPTLFVPQIYTLQSSRLQEVLNLTLPVPMPVALVLGAYANYPAFGLDVPALRGPIRFPGFALTRTGFPQTEPAGVFVIEWGAGEARNYTVVDLAPCSLQLPVAQGVKVSAYYFHAPAFGADAPVVATASAYPGEQHPAPDATLTMAMYEPGLVVPTPTWTKGFTLPPYAREWSAGVMTTVSPPTVALRVVVEGFGVFGAPPIGAWNLVATDPGPPPFVATAAELPSALFAQPLPGGAFTLRASLFGAVLGVVSGAYVTTKVRI